MFGTKRRKLTNHTTINSLNDDIVSGSSQKYTLTENIDELFRWFVQVLLNYDQMSTGVLISLSSY